MGGNSRRRLRSDDGAYPEQVFDYGTGGKAALVLIILTFAAVLVNLGMLAVNTHTLRDTTDRIRGLDRSLVNFHGLEIYERFHGQSNWAFERTLAEGAQCRLSTTFEIPRPTPKQRRNEVVIPSCLLCPCFPKNLEWTIDPERKDVSSQEDRVLCPSNCKNSGVTLPLPGTPYHSSSSSSAHTDDTSSYSSDGSSSSKP